MATMTRRNILVAFLLLIACSKVTAVRDLQIVTPLRALTIPDEGFDSEADLSRRQAFLERFQAGMEAELKIQEGKGEKELGFLNQSSEQAFEKATKEVAAQQESRRKLMQNNSAAQKYQFVGVIQSPEESSDAAISWYARPKPKGARWSMRLVHVNREAVLKHLFDQGKIDIYGQYQTNKDETTGERMVQAKYTVKPRSWRTAWNTHPKRWFTESSGMFWRERRLREGLYTDGKNVYEASYRYQDGRNGMHLRSSLEEYLNSRSVDPDQKRKVQEKLEKSPPDVVLEL